MNEEAMIRKYRKMIEDILFNTKTLALNEGIFASTNEADYIKEFMAKANDYFDDEPFTGTSGDAIIIADYLDSTGYPLEGSDHTLDNLENHMFTADSEEYDTIDVDRRVKDFVLYYENTTLH